MMLDFFKRGARMLPVCKNTKVIAILDRAKFWYSILYLVYFYLFMLMPFMIWKGERDIFLYSLIGYIGAALLAADLILRQNMIRTKGFWLLAAFFVSTGISILLNRELGLASGIKSAMWFAIEVGLLTSFDPDVEEKTHDRHFRIIGDVILLLQTAGVLRAFYSLITWEHLKFPIYIDGKWVYHLLGFVLGRLYGIFVDPNFACVLSFFVIGFILFRLKTSRKSVGGWIGGIAVILLHFLYIVLSGSRTALLALVMTAVCSGLFYGIGDRKSGIREKKRIRAIGIALLGLVIVVAGYLAVTGYAVNHTGLKKEDLHFLWKLFNDPRLQIWKGYLEIWKNKPLFGVGPRNALAFSGANYDENFFINTKGYDVHNGYLTLFVGAGLIGGVIFLTWLVKKLSRIWRAGFGAAERDNYSKAVSILLMTIFAYMCCACTLTMITFSNQVYDMLFWILFGYASYKAENNSNGKLVQ